MADQNGPGLHEVTRLQRVRDRRYEPSVCRPTDDGPVLESTEWTQPSDHAPTYAPTSLGRRSSSLMLTERSRRRSEAEKGPRPWPDDRLYNNRSLFLFTLQNPFRQAIIRMIEWEHWDNKVIGVILCNTITLAMYDCFDTPQMRMCAPEDLNTPAGPYGYCNKMKTGIAPLPRLRLPSRPQRAPSHRHDACTCCQPPPYFAPQALSVPAIASRNPVDAHNARSLLSSCLSR